MKTLEEKYENDILRSLTASMTMQILDMRMLKSTVFFIREIVYYISNNYTYLNQAFSYTT